MQRILRKITTVGLMVRDELLIKSLLSLVKGKTIVDWEYIDELDADLALCDSDSFLTRAAMRLQSKTGKPYCVALLAPDQEMPTIPSLQRPIRPAALIEALNAWANEIHSAKPVVAKYGAPVEIKGAFNSHAGMSGIEAMLETRSQRSIWQLNLGDQKICVLFPEQRFVCIDRSFEVFSSTFPGIVSDMTVQRLSDNERASLDRQLPSRPLDELLWLIARRSTETSLETMLGNASLHLKRWPDFGRLPFEPWYFSITATLTQRYYTLTEVVGMTNQSVAEVVRFLIGCKLCGLLEYEGQPSTASRPHDAPVVQRRWSGIIRSIRETLGL